MTTEQTIKPPKVYKRRYYILLVFSLQLVVLLATFNSFSPIANSLEYATAFTQQDMAILAMLNNGVFLFCMIPASAFVHRFGIRVYMIFQSVSLTLTMVLRCIPTTGRTFVVMCMVQNFLASGLSVGLMTIPPLLSVRWFPQAEWRFATGLGIFLPTVGSSFVYKIGPAVVPAPHGDYSASQIRDRMHYFYYGLTVVCGLMAGVIIAYFPERPPTPPTNIAEDEDGHRGPTLLESVKKLIVSKRFWLCCFRTLTIGAPTQAISSLLLPYLSPKGISQDYAGTIGLVSALCGVAAALALGLAADYTKTHLKALIVAPTILACEGAIWLFLMGHGWLPLSNRSVFLASSLYVVFGGGALGLVIELACENSYPVPEEFVSAMIMAGSNATTLVITGVFMAPKNSVVIADYIVLILTILGTIGSFFLPSHYLRMNADRKKSIRKAKLSAAGGHPSNPALEVAPEEIDSGFQGKGVTASPAIDKSPIN